MPTSVATRPIDPRTVADRVLREAEVVIERVRHRPHHELRQLVEADHREHQQREPAVDAEELRERTDDGVEEAAARSTAAFRLSNLPRGAARSGSLATRLAPIPIAISAAIAAYDMRQPKWFAEIRMSASVTMIAAR